MNCATTNQHTFENGHPFERGPVCSDAIHRIAAEVLFAKKQKTPENRKRFIQRLREAQ